MATIFYHNDSGDIYGVHPSGQPVTGGVPAGVVSIEVPEAPDQIPWPSPGGPTAGSEHSSRVNPVTRAIEAAPGWVKPRLQQIQEALAKVPAGPIKDVLTLLVS